MTQWGQTLFLTDEMTWQCVKQNCPLWSTTFTGRIIHPLRGKCCDRGTWPLGCHSALCPGGAGTQTRVDAWIHNQIKTVRSDRSGRQSSWSCWINEAPASFRMPGFWMTRLITAHLPEPFLYCLNVRAPKRHPVISFSSVYRPILVVTLSSCSGGRLPAGHFEFSVSAEK